VRKLFSVLTLISVGLAGFALVAGPAGAATSITSPTGNPYAVAGISGTPQSFTITASGFPPSTSVFVEQCDGVSPSAQGWSPTADCDNLTSPAPVITTAGGVATFTKDDPNHGITPFKGAGPGGLFNCLAQNDAATNNGVPDYKNCSLRVSTNNATITGDQVFLNLLLPASGAAPVETCRVSGTWSAKTGLTNTAPAKPKGNPAKGDGTVGAGAGGSCAQTVTTKFPITTGTVKIKAKIVKGAVCTSALTMPTDGPMTFTVKWQGINPKNGKLSTVGKSAVTVASFSSTTLPNVTYTATGPTTGIFQGKTAHLNLVLDQSQLTLNSQCNGSGFKTVSFTGAVSPSTIQFS
jgi:hypothetical protein